MNKEIDEIIFWGRRLYEKDLSPSTSGNISARFKENFLVTASGTCAGDLTKEDVILIDKNAKILEGNKKPTSEKDMHLGVYKKRKDINVIIHCHCPILTAFAVSGMELNKAILPDFALIFKKVQLIPFFCPSTKELASAVTEVFKTDDTVLLKNHGIVIGGKNLKETFYKLESLQAYAKTLLYSQILGNTKVLTKKSIQQIEELYK